MFEFADGEFLGHIRSIAFNDFINGTNRDKLAFEKFV